MTAEQAVMALEGFISDAILAGHESVQVIHGRSGGRLKAAVHARLRELPSIAGFRVDPANDGVTIVRF
jgi:DNA mismatch repair protein MutS2